MKEYHLKIVSPSESVFDGNVLKLSVRGSCGDLAIMAGHIPFVTTIRGGKISLTLPDTVLTATASGGLLTVSKDSVSLLVSDFVWQNEAR